MRKVRGKMIKGVDRAGLTAGGGTEEDLRDGPGCLFVREKEIEAEGLKTSQKSAGASTKSSKGE